ncbi:aminoacylase-1-like [Trichoplusia ni]|uniref:N-acyl-aliphatic-L-amino acid amidohydrolase n=1 Tax=Trichoplusia ni TaxID=7111 RepID=A0A7E5WI99_TRINI|nr:aminoacylase-1-like [Trichoplusia ni]
MSTKWDDNEVVQRFREYLRIPSVHPDPDYSGCVEFLKKMAGELGLPVVVYEFVPKKPVVVMSWVGEQPDEPSILLNSHIDVVPVNEENWLYPPFSAHINEDGYIYARGTQDMKSIGMMHIEAVRKLKEAGVKLKRTFHLSFVPDEEIGGLDGMAKFSESNEFKKLNIGFALDESVSNKDPNEIIAFNSERTSRQITVSCPGQPGHGSLLTSNTAGERLHHIISQFMGFRAQEKKKVEEDGVWIGDVTTINLTQISGGVQINVLPDNLTVSFDIRIAPQVDHDEFEAMLSRWCTEAGSGVTFEYIVKNPQVKSTPLEGNIYWETIQQVVGSFGVKIRCVTCPGATDARYVRRQGIPAINFSPIMNSELLLHCNNETIHVDVYLKGVDIMTEVVRALGDL